LATSLEKRDETEPAPESSTQEPDAGSLHC
jgi:hypothetical protein